MVSYVVILVDSIITWKYLLHSLVGGRGLYFPTSLRTSLVIFICYLGAATWRACEWYDPLSFVSNISVNHTWISRLLRFWSHFKLLCVLMCISQPSFLLYMSLCSNSNVLLRFLFFQIKLRRVWGSKNKISFLPIRINFYPFGGDMSGYFKLE